MCVREAGELNDDRTHNVANELTARDTNDSGSDDFTLTYDAVGNLIDDGEDYEYVYYPFGRLRFVKRTDNQAVVAEYRYNGLGFRVGWHYDVDADGTVENTADDPWFFFAYDEGWRMVATYRSTDSSPKEQFVHHAAGLGGFGGSPYIDAVVLRERDANTAWASAADGTLEERLYYVQNWRADVVAIVTDTGGMVEWVKYSAYGVPFALPAGDTDSDGDFDAADVAAITGGYEVRKDVELDGDAFDILAAAAITGGYQMLGRDTLSSPAVNSRRGYAGYEYDPTFAGVDRHLYHVRHRVYDAELGRWTRRDSLGYVDGMNLYEYAVGRPLANSDPLGTQCRSAACNLASGPPFDILDPCHGPFENFAPPFDPREYEAPVFLAGCSTSDTKCIKQYLSDPDIKRVLRSIKSCLLLRQDNKFKERDGVLLECGADCNDSHTPTKGRLSIILCGLYKQCNTTDKSTLLHELIHVRQRCEQGGSWMSSCRNRLCAEVEAYCEERGYPPCADPARVCSQACGSAGYVCEATNDVGFAACEALCKSIVHQCFRGRWAPTPGWPGSPGYLPPM